MIESFLTIYFLAVIEPATLQGVREAENEMSIEQIFSLPSPFLKNPHFIAPVLKSKSALAINEKTNTILFQKNPSSKLQIASLTKLMTAYIILSENRLDEIVTASKNAAETPGSKIWLYPGEKITIQNLLYGLLIPSGNDAAVALAEHNADTVEAFVEKMNSYTQKLEMLHTHFDNPEGLDSEENYSTAMDLAILSKKVLTFPIISEIVKNKTFVITSLNGKLKHKLENTNKLLGGYLSIKGLKTGRTVGAGECLISIVDDHKGGNIITIILGSPDRFQETKVLIDWIYRAFNL